MRPCSNAALQTVCVLIFLLMTPTTVEGDRQQRQRSTAQGRGPWEITEVKSCTRERCIYSCAMLKNFDEEAVEDAHCEGSQCVCKYKRACNVSDCYQKCAREKFVKLFKKSACFMRECFCLFEDRCEKRSCAEGCPGKRRLDDGVKGVCIGSGCSCRWA
ncbi:uncharacterized protein LOC125942248 [Dermacentor silvarum]|uniref:uncharacterized protein LOC125942248 n=1 Tax=Dermacentor silvarum TaxID=543639 RepID=UPI0021015A8E|nr:uncharacterized protein LOC125942248 [Dermacentor silvarum]